MNWVSGRWKELNVTLMLKERKRGERTREGAKGGKRREGGKEEGGFTANLKQKGTKDVGP